MRMRLDKLARKEHIWHAGAGRFTGVSYDVQASGEIAGLYNMIDGEVIGPHRDWSEGKQRFDVARTTWPDESAFPLVNGQPFTGVLYEFDQSGHLVEEMEVHDRDTVETHTKTWYPSGALEGIAYGPIGTEWSDQGQRLTEKTRDLSVIFEPDGTLASIFLLPSYTGCFCDEYSPVVSTNLRLKGSIDDQLVCQLVGLENLKLLVLERTNITRHGMRAFRVANSLERLQISENDSFSRVDCQELITNLAGCELIDMDE